MPRTPPSASITSLVEELTFRGVPISATKIERWISERLLKKPQIMRLGRKGSQTVLPHGFAFRAELLAWLPARHRNIEMLHLARFACGEVDDDVLEAIRTWMLMPLHDLVEEIEARTKRRTDLDREDAIAESAISYVHQQTDICDDHRAVFARLGLDSDSADFVPALSGLIAALLGEGDDTILAVEQLVSAGSNEQPNENPNKTGGRIAASMRELMALNESLTVKELRNAHAVLARVHPEVERPGSGLSGTATEHAKWALGLVVNLRQQPDLLSTFMAGPEQ